MDYCISNALSFNSEGLPEAAVIYDLVCQWGVHYIDRLERCPSLSIPFFEELILGIGKFHLGSHVEKCFYRHSLNFIEGTGQVDGEIIKTLWSRLNPVSSMARSMTRSHRQEVLDAAMRDWNWKKLIGVGMDLLLPWCPWKFELTCLSIVQALVDKWANAVEGEDVARVGFTELTSRLHENLTQQWEEEEAKALQEGGDALSIYGDKFDEGLHTCQLFLFIYIHHLLVSTYLGRNTSSIG